MLVVAAEGLVDVEQEDKQLGLLQMGLLACTLEQLRGQQLRLVVMLTNRLSHLCTLKGKKSENLTVDSSISLKVINIGTKIIGKFHQ